MADTYLVRWNGRGWSIWYVNRRGRTCRGPIISHHAIEDVTEWCGQRGVIILPQ